MKKKLNIVYEDKEFLVIDKDAKVLTIGTNKDKVHTLYHEVREYIRKKNQRIFIVNRLDRDTSGLVLFVKNENLKKILQDNWNDIATRKYYAIVEGILKEKKGTLKNYLRETKTLDVYVSDDKRDKLAILNYEVINELNNYSLLDIEIKTGRRNQIRCQLANINHKIIGDKKYDSKVNPISRLALHAYELDIINPLNKKTYKFVSKMPKNFFEFFSKK